MKTKKEKSVEDLIPVAITFEVLRMLYLSLDNYYRLRILELLEKKPYYISELQRELGIKVYKSIHDTLKVLLDNNLVKMEKKHNTSGRQVEVTLDRLHYDTPTVQEIIKEYRKKHKLD